MLIVVLDCKLKQNNDPGMSSTHLNSSGRAFAPHRCPIRKILFLNIGTSVRHQLQIRLVRLDVIDRKFAQSPPEFGLPNSLLVRSVPDGYTR